MGMNYKVVVDIDLSCIMSDEQVGFLLFELIFWFICFFDLLFVVFIVSISYICFVYWLLVVILFLFKVFFYS